MSKISVSIVNWNTKDELKMCLEDVLSQDCCNDCEIIVVDNASSDGSQQMIESDYNGKITFIKNSTNVGFGAGHNIAYSYSSGDYFFILNPDSRIPNQHTLKNMADFMDENPDIGILGPKITNPDGSLQFSARTFPRIMAGIFRQTILGKWFPENSYVRNYLMTSWPHNELRDVDWMSGCALMIRKEMVEQIGLFDERYFMYVEDMDLCRRAHISNWRVVYYPMQSMIHKIGAASDKSAKAMIKQHHKSMLKYFIKYNSRSPKILLTPFVMLGIYIRMKSILKKAGT